MANPVYSAVRDGMVGLVSDRAADAVLARGLERAGSDPERVDAATMSRLLRGVVRRELERSLPRSAVRTRLAALDRALHRPDGASASTTRAAVTASAPADAAPADTVPADTVPADTVRTDPPPVEARPAPPGHDADTAPHVAVEPPSPSASPIAPPTAPPTAPRPFPQGAIDRLAERDAVRQWVWIPEHGTPRARGAGPAPDDVVHVVAPTLRGLNRYGAVRRLHVRHGRGQVVLGARDDDLLIIAGDATLNVGAIRSTLRALEEEP